MEPPMKPTLPLLAALLLTPLALLSAEPAAALWDKREPLLKAAELPVLKDAQFSVIDLSE